MSDFQSLRDTDRVFLRRTIELAQLACSNTTPNPRVGAVIVHDGRIIGEGYHHAAGQPHAEPMAVAAVKHKELLKASTLYVSLEPCNHHGRTPACTNLILDNKIPRVVVGALDPNPRVAGSGLQRLVENGVAVAIADDHEPFVLLNKGFWMSQLEGRPWVTLKWAQTPGGMLGDTDKRLKITGPAANRAVHRLRAEHAAIMVGRGTAAADQPSLTTRLHHGPSPVRVVLDSHLILDATQRPFAQAGNTLWLNTLKDSVTGSYSQVKLEELTDIGLILKRLYAGYGLTSVLVEGGAKLHASFLAQNLADELVVLTGAGAWGGNIAAPAIPEALQLHTSTSFNGDLCRVYRNPGSFARILNPVLAKK